MLLACRFGCGPLVAHAVEHCMFCPASGFAARRCLGSDIRAVEDEVARAAFCARLACATKPTLHLDATVMSHTASATSQAATLRGHTPAGWKPSGRICPCIRSRPHERTFARARAPHADWTIAGSNPPHLRVADGNNIADSSGVSGGVAACRCAPKCEQYPGYGGWAAPGNSAGGCLARGGRDTCASPRARIASSLHVARLGTCACVAQPLCIALALRKSSEKLGTVQMILSWPLLRMIRKHR